MENVKALVQKRFKPLFDKWIKSLEELGYTTYWQVLNGVDFNVPQNRERVFAVSILGDTEGYKFPKPKRRTRKLKDVLEAEVDSKYYINVQQVIQRMTNKYNHNRNSILTGGYAGH